LELQKNFINCLKNKIIEKHHYREGTYVVNNFENIFFQITQLGADQVTFRKMWASTDESPINKWIRDNTIQDEVFFTNLHDYIKSHAELIGKLTFGALQYSLDKKLSISIDFDCMSTEVKEEYKYLILRENCKLYFLWDNYGSLIF